MQFKLTNEEQEQILAKVCSCNRKLDESVKEIEELFSLLHDEYASISLELQSSISKRIEALSCFSWKIKIQKIKVEPSGRVVSKKVDSGPNGA